MYRVDDYQSSKITDDISISHITNRMHESNGVLKLPMVAIFKFSNYVNKNPPTWPDQPTLEGSSYTSIMTCTGGCGYSL